MKLLLRGWPRVALKTNAMFHKRRVSSAQFMAANAEAETMAKSTKRKRELAICIACGEIFSARSSDVAKGWGKFCSRYCQRKQQAAVNARNNSTGLTRGERKRRWMKKVGASVIRAHHAVELAILNGSIQRLPCEKCGREPSDAHHDDYTKPLAVRWLCRFHHLQHHREFK